MKKREREIIENKIYRFIIHVGKLESSGYKSMWVDDVSRKRRFSASNANVLSRFTLVIWLYRFRELFEVLINFIKVYHQSKGAPIYDQLSNIGVGGTMRVHALKSLSITSPVKFRSNKPLP